MTANYSPEDPGPLVTDADLIRYLDGELNADDQVRVDGALERDRALADRFNVLRRRSGRLSALLATASPSAREVAAARPAGADDVRPIPSGRVVRMAPEPPKSVWSEHRIWLRAAIVLIVLGGVMAVPPVRAWVIRNVQRITSEQTPSPAPAPAPEAAQPPADNFAVNFPVSAATVTIEVTEAQSQGRLIIRLLDVTEASAEIVGEVSEESFLVLPDRNTLRIQNSSRSRADYLITMPRHVAEVLVSVGRKLTRSHAFTPQLLELEIPLGR